MDFTIDITWITHIARDYELFVWVFCIKSSVIWSIYPCDELTGLFLENKSEWTACIQSKSQIRQYPQKEA